MAWKQSLAKLKQELKEEPLVAQAPKHRVVAKPQEGPPKSIEEEDAMFLAAMGGRTRTQAPGVASRLTQPPAAPTAPPPAPPANFEEAMAELKGMKSLHDTRPGLTPMPPALAPQNPPVVASPLPPSPHLPDPALEMSPQEPPPPPTSPSLVPRKIHLAAGMALEVDGTLDLRGHSESDAFERLQERIHDGRFLGWRTLHVQLGADPSLHHMMQAFLEGAASGLLTQYAQAPIPMGGSQAWILYFPATSN